MEANIASATIRRAVKLPAYEDGKKLDYSGYEYDVSVTGADADAAMAEAERLSANERAEYELRYGRAAKANPMSFSEPQMKFLSFVASKGAVPELAFLLGYEGLTAALNAKLGTGKLDAMRSEFMAKMKK